MSHRYSTASFGMMMRDRRRIEAYARALERAVTPGSSVLDIGTGTGIMAFLALRYGAKRVVGVDPNDAIEVAREIARDNAFGDRLQLVHGLSTELPDDAFDVIVSDLRTFTPYAEGHIASIADARRRLLAPEGRLIAARDEVFVAPVESKSMWEAWVGVWDENPAGVDMSAAKQRTANLWAHHLGPRDELVCPPQRVSDLDYMQVVDPNVTSTHVFQAERRCVVYGFSVWFETTLDEAVRLSTAPGEPRLAYGRPWFPLLEPAGLDEGDELRLELSARLVRGDYIWRWRGRSPAGTFDHSTFYGLDLNLRGAGDAVV